MYTRSGEFGFIEEIRRLFQPMLPPGIEGIGDDCAVIPLNDREGWVITTDMLIENVHFLTDRITPYELGYKSLAVNLSDVAAMGAYPVASFLSIGLPERMDDHWRMAFLQEYKSLSERFGVPLLGGDTTASEELAINITLLGKAELSTIKRRSMARVGDRICVTGNLGNSGAGLKLLQTGASCSSDEKELIRLHHHPKPYVREGIWLGRHPGVHAMMDVSDGLASDLVHILEASSVSARIELEQLPCSETLLRICARHEWNAEELAASAGEDYVLLLTVAREDYDELSARYQAEFGVAWSLIGEVTEGESEITWTRSGKTVPVKWSGFKHF